MPAETSANCSSIVIRRAMWFSLALLAEAAGSAFARINSPRAVRGFAKHPKGKFGNDEEGDFISDSDGEY